MTAKADCVIVGYAGVDRVIRVERFSQNGATSIILNGDNRNVYFGGNGSNVAYCMAKLGCAVYPLMRVGGLDERELGYIRHFKDAGVITDGIRVVPGETTSVCHLVEDAKGNHLTMSYPGAMNVRYATEDYDDSVFSGAKYGIITVSTYADTVQFLQKCRRHALPMVLAMRADRESFSHFVLKDILHEAEIIFANETERRFIEEEYGLSSITELMRRGNARIIVTTLGADGCAVYERTQDGGIKESRVAATRPERVVDATGAGDSFIAGFMYGILHGYPAERCAEFASTEAAFIIEKVGCITNAPDEKQMLKRNETRQQEVKHG